MQWTLIPSGILLTGIFLLFKGALVVGTPCSPAERNNSLSTCLDNIRSKMLDPNIFWFGNSYASRCNDSTDYTQCANTAPDKTSIETRLFTGPTPMSSMDRFLELRYESSGKNYNACGNHFLTTETWSYDVDPLSDTIVYPWYVRNFPIYVNWDFEVGDMFTLIVYDVGNFITHGVYINIQGDDMTTAEAIKPYSGPLRTAETLNAYIFFLYKQTGAMQLPAEWMNSFTIDFPATVWTFEKMAEDLNLLGPVGANFIVATGDEYAAGQMMSRQFLVMCPLHTTRALRQETRPFIPSDVQLSVWIEFNFTNEQLDFSVCCKDYSYGARTFTLNPLGNPIYTTADVRTSNPHSLNFRKQGMYFSSTDFTGNTYTLITFDPDVPNSGVGTESRPLLHGLVTNIEDGNMATGDYGLEYQGPQPPDTIHTYYTFLYEQQGKLNATEMMMKYDGNSCYESLVGRCLFDINRAVSENNLTLVGATWFRATRDAYVIQRNVQSGANESEVCKALPNYPRECDTSGSAIMTSSVILVLIIGCIELLLPVYRF